MRDHGRRALLGRADGLGDHLVVVRIGSEIICGQIAQSDRGELVIKAKPPREHYRGFPLATVSGIRPVDSC